MKIITPIIQFLIFPGFLFTAIVGLLASWIDRKVTARVQYRIGPPWYQPLADIIKLLGKETLIPDGASRILFLTAPLIGLASVTLVSMLLWLTNLNAMMGFIGDIIVTSEFMRSQREGINRWADALEDADDDFHLYLELPDTHISS